jgi:virginiamycin B lyase
MLIVAAEDVSGQVITEFFDPRFLYLGPDRIAGGPDGNVWFTIRGSGSLGVGSISGKIGRITPAGTIDVFPLVTSPLDITSGPDGNLWITEDCTGPVFPCFGRIGRMTPSGGLTEFQLSAGVPFRITSGPDGALWYTSFAANKIGRIGTDGSILEFPLLAGSGPGDIVSGPDGNLWFTESGSNRIGRITPTGVLTEFPIPTEMSFPTEITVGPDRNLWFNESFVGKIGRITTAGVLTEFPVSAKDIVGGPDGNLWFTSPGTNSIGRTTPSGVTTLYPIPTADAFPRGITSGPDGNIWFTEERWQIGRLDVPAVTCSTEPFSACLGGRFEVAIEWSVPAQGISGAGVATPLTADTASFWFFSSNNIEVVVKVVDGRAANGSFWVFYGSLSDVEYTVFVRDTETGRLKTYFNASGQLASVADTSTF